MKQQTHTRIYKEDLKKIKLEAVKRGIRIIDVLSERINNKKIGENSQVNVNNSKNKLPK